MIIHLLTPQHRKNCLMRRVCAAVSRCVPVCVCVCVCLFKSVFGTPGRGGFDRDTLVFPFLSRTPSGLPLKPPWPSLFELHPVWSSLRRNILSFVFRVSLVFFAYRPCHESHPSQLPSPSLYRKTQTRMTQTWVVFFLLESHQTVYFQSSCFHFKVYFWLTHLS